MKIQKRGVVPDRGKSQKGIITAYAGIITYMISLGLRIPLSRVIGDAGVGLFAPAFEFFTLTALLFSYGISRTMTGLIRYRVKRGQYRNARKVFSSAFKISLFGGMGFALVLALASGYLSETLMLEAMSKKAIIAAAPTVFLAALVSVFRGYFNGNGFGVLVAHSQYIEKIVMLISAVFGGRMSYDYGNKVAALLHNDLVAYAYGALGVVLGIMVSQTVTLAYLLLVFCIYSGTWKRQIAQDSGRRMESSGEFTGMLLGGGVPAAFIAVLANVFMLMDQRFFNYCMNRTGSGGTRTALWGSYYGKFAVLTGIGAALTCLAVQGHIGKIAFSYDKEEYHMMRDRIGGAVKKLCVAAFPIAINLAVLAEAFVNVLYQGDNELAVSMVRRGTVIIFFYGFIYLFGQLMLKMHMIKELLFSLTVSLALHLLAVFLLVRKGLQGMDGIVYSVIIFMGVLALLCFFFTCRRVSYRQELLYSFAFPAVSACLSGLLVMLLNKLLLNAAGEILTILISCLISTILYFLLLMILRVLNEAELTNLPLGGLWVALGRMIGVL